MGRKLIDINPAVISKAILKNGVTMQSVVYMEECAELAKEISKQIRENAVFSPIPAALLRTNAPELVGVGK